MEIRKLTKDDLPQWWPLRLRALKEYPASFGADYDSASQLSFEQVQGWIESMIGGDNFIIGAFDPDMVGTAGLVREDGAKKRHKAEVWAVYVAPEAQGRGVGRMMLDAVVKYAQQIDGLDHLILGVEVNNQPALNLYRAVGFQQFAYDPRTMKVGDQFIDEYLMVHWLGHQPTDFRPLR